jgi:hypothetical protein
VAPAGLIPEKTREAEYKVHADGVEGSRGPWAARVFRFRMLAVNKSMKRQVARSPARPNNDRHLFEPARARYRGGL